MTLRSVRLDDCPDLWEWRNDLETRRNSVVAEEIPWSDHLRWFNASVANPDRLIFIGELSGNKCGMVRFDRLQHASECVGGQYRDKPAFAGQRIGRASRSPKLAPRWQRGIASAYLLRKCAHETSRPYACSSDVDFRSCRTRMTLSIYGDRPVLVANGNYVGNR